MVHKHLKNIFKTKCQGKFRIFSIFRTLEQSVQKPEKIRNPPRPELSGFSKAWHEKPENFLTET